MKSQAGMQNIGNTMMQNEILFKEKKKRFLLTAQEVFQGIPW